MQFTPEIDDSVILSNNKIIISFHKMLLVITETIISCQIRIGVEEVTRYFSVYLQYLQDNATTIHSVGFLLKRKYIVIKISCTFSYFFSFSSRSSSIQNNACKSSLAICRKRRALCPLRRLLSVLI